MGAVALPVKLVISNDFLASFSKIPRSQQNKVLDFVNKFRSDPTLPGINYEKVEGAKDPKIRSVRIDLTYRGIVLRPAKGNVYVLLWVDLHDRAYEWAVNKVCSTHRSSAFPLFKRRWILWLGDSRRCKTRGRS